MKSKLQQEPFIYEIIIHFFTQKSTAFLQIDEKVFSWNIYGKHLDFSKAMCIMDINMLYELNCLINAAFYPLFSHSGGIATEIWRLNQ